MGKSGRKAGVGFDAKILKSKEDKNNLALTTVTFYLAS